MLENGVNVRILNSTDYTEHISFDRILFEIKLIFMKRQTLLIPQLCLNNGD